MGWDGLKLTPDSPAPDVGEADQQRPTDWNDQDGYKGA